MKDVLGLAVTSDRVVAVTGTGSDPASMIERRYALETSEGETSLDGALRAVLEEALTRPGKGRHLAVALLPPVATVRRVALPPLSDRDLQNHLDRRGARYVPYPVEGWSAAAAAPEASGARASPRWIALGDGSRVEAVYRVADQLGLRVRCVAPAVVAWRRMLSDEPSIADRATLVVVGSGERANAGVLHALWTASDGTLRYRRFPWTDVGLQALKAAAPPSVSCRPLADDERSVGALAAWLNEAEIATSPLDGRGNADAAQEAARWIRNERGPWLVPPPVRARAARAGRWRVGALLAASACLLLASGLARTWGLERELGALRDERASIAPLVVQALSLEERVRRLEGALDELGRVQGESPRWSEVLADLTTGLPRSAYLASLRTVGDTLHVDAVATDVVAAYRALERMPRILELRPVTAVQRQPIEGDRMIERVTLSGRAAGGSLP